MNDIAILGAGGFIGGHLAKYLRDKGYWVRGVGTSHHKFMEREEFCDEFLLLDLRNYNDTVEAVRDIDQVYNLAAKIGGVSFVKKNYGLIWDNVSINKNVVEACRKFDVGRVFFSSSACVYPLYNQSVEWKEWKYMLKESEVFPADSDGFYGWEKLFSELIYWAYYLDYGLDIRIGRYNGIYGTMAEMEGSRAKAPIALCRKVAQLPSEGGKVEIWGNGWQVRSFLDVRDCCEATYKVMNCPNEKYYKLGVMNQPRPPALNIGSDEETTINGLVDIIADISGKELEKVHDLTKPEGVRARSTDLTLVTRTVNWKPKYPLREGMTALYNWVDKQVNKHH